MGWKSTGLEDFHMHLLRERERYEKFSCLPEHEGGKVLIEQLICEVERRASAERNAEWSCHDCGRPAPIHVFVPEEYWRMVRPTHREQGGVLCLYCMCERLTNCGVGDGHLRNVVTYSNGPFSAFNAQAETPNPPHPSRGSHE